MSLIGFLLLQWRVRGGLTLLAIGACLGYVCSIPITANLLSRSLQIYPPLTDTTAWTHQQPQMIVVLGGGLHEQAAAEYGSALNVSARTLQRVRYAAYLARRTGLPVLASGGISYTEALENAHHSEAQAIQTLLEQEFGLFAVRSESASRDTWENAVNSAALLRELNMRTILLVTDAVHMRRALGAFAAQSLSIIPAPTGFFDERIQPLRLHSWLPSVIAISTVHYVSHEWLGRIWYALRH